MTDEPNDVIRAALEEIVPIHAATAGQICGKRRAAA
jgi:hypothetical protein